jgi:hypothetical protein
MTYKGYASGYRDGYKTGHDDIQKEWKVIARGEVRYTNHSGWMIDYKKIPESFQYAIIPHEGKTIEIVVRII